MTNDTCKRYELPDGECNWEVQFSCPRVGCDYHEDES